MAFIPYPDGVLAVVEQSVGADDYTNTLWFELLVGQNHDLQGLADWLHNWWGSQIMPNLSTSVALTNVRAYQMDTASSPAVDSTGAAVPGGQAGAPAPISAAMVATFYTGGRGRSSRGRNYIAGWTDDDVTAIQLADGTLVGNIITAYEYLRDNIQQNTGYVWVVASKQNGGVPRTEILGTQIASIESRSSLLGSQRRRIRRT